MQGKSSRMGTVKVQAVAPSVTPAGANERDKYMKSVNSKEGLEALREAWKKVGTKRRGEASTCGVCGCKSNLWVMAGNTMIGIREFLVCPGKQAYPELHEKVSRKQDLLWEDRLPETTQEEITIEINRLLARFAVIKPDIVLEPQQQKSDLT